MPAGMRANGAKAPTSPVGSVDLTGWGPSTTYLTEWAETVPDLQWPESVRTYGRMRRDPKLTAVLSAFFLPIRRATWAVDPAGVTNAKAVELVATDLGLPVLGDKGRPPEPALRGFRWHEHVRLALLSLVYGHFPFEQWYDTQGKDGLTHLAGVAERQPHTLAFIDVGDDGQIKTVEQATQDQPIPARRLLWYVNEREGANWAGVSLLRSCYTPWVLKHEVMRVHATSHRRWGMGVPVVHAPPGATPAQLEEARRLAAGMRAGDTAGAGLPAGFTFELAGITGSVPDAVAFVNLLNQEMAGSALAKIIELGTTSEGSRALGDTFLDLFLLALQAAADAIGDTATYGDPAMPGLSRALTDYNFGEDEPCPRIVATDVGDRHEITAAAIQQLVACGAIQADDELESYLRDAWSLPGRKSPRTPPPAPPAKPALPQPGQPGTPAPGTAAPGGPGGGTSSPPPPQPAPPAQPTGPPGRRGGQPATATARPDGLARDLTTLEVRAGLDPLAIRRELESARDRLLAQWAPVLAAQRTDLADQVAAAVDAGQLSQLATISTDPGPAAGLLYAAMRQTAAQAAARMIAEAAAQGITIDPATVTVDEDRLRELAQARAVMAAGQLAAAASRRALQVVTATAGTETAHAVTATLIGLSVANLADELMAAMHTAANAGRFAVLAAEAMISTRHGRQPAPHPDYTATEILDSNTCFPCKEIDGHQFASLADAQAAYANGGYNNCDGGLRCRGTVIATWPQPPAPGTPEAYEEALPGPLGRNLTPRSWTNVALGGGGEPPPFGDLLAGALNPPAMRDLISGALEELAGAAYRTATQPPDPATAPFTDLIEAAFREADHPRIRHGHGGGQFTRKPGGLKGTDYEGETGNPDHITRNEAGTVPTAAIAHLPGVKGERPGEHRNRQGAAWEAFKKDIARNGIKQPIFITVDYGQEPRISEGSHRRDAAVELGLAHVPVQVRYFGHAERQGTLTERQPGTTRPGQTSKTLNRGTGHAVTDAPATVLSDFAAKAAPAVPGLLGGGQQMWNGQITTFQGAEHPDWAGVMDWDGKISLLDSVAEEITTTVSHPDRPVSDPDAFDVILHELLHGVMGGRTGQADKDWAALPAPDQAVLETFGRLDRDSPAGGAYPIVHTLDEVRRELWSDTDVTQGQIDALTGRGLLVKADFSNIVYTPDTGEPVRQELWKLSPQARRIVPGPPPDRHADARAYSADQAVANIEEGFNELGATLHAEQFVTAMGVGARPTGMLARDKNGEPVDNPAWARQAGALVDELRRAREALAAEAAGPVETQTWQHAIAQVDAAIEVAQSGNPGFAEDITGELARLGSPAGAKAATAITAALQELYPISPLKHATLAEYARRLADPERIRNAQAWGHYPDLTAGALAWSQEIASLDGVTRLRDKPGSKAWLRVRQITDEINREGAEDKIVAMARQVVTRWGGDPDEPGVPWGRIEAAIEADWPDGARAVYDAGTVVSKWLDAKHPRAATPRPRPPVTTPAGPRTAAGRKAAELAAWAWADPGARAAAAAAQTAELARQSAEDQAALREVQDTGRMLARLASAVTPATAAAFDPAEHPRIPGGKGGGQFTRKGGELDYTPLLGKDLGSYGEGSGKDDALAALAHLAGFDGPPDAVTDSELDARVAAGERECWRGLNGFNGGREEQTRGFARAFLNGPYFAGNGGWGNGTYTASEDTKTLLADVERNWADAPRDETGQFTESWARKSYARDIARAKGKARDNAAAYASSHGTLLRMTLDKNARVITWDDLYARWQQRHAEFLQHPPADDRAQRELKLLNDPGRFAIILGYDAVDISRPAPGEFLILNRTALHVSSRLQDAWPQ